MDEFSKIAKFDAQKDNEVTYPYVKSKEDEGFKWFVENKQAEKFNTKMRIFTNINSPNERSQMRISKVLADDLRVNSQEQKYEKKPSVPNSQTRNNERPRQTNGQQYIKGQQYKGKVSNIKDEKYVYVQLDKGGKASFPIWEKKDVKIGDEVWLEYKEKNEKGYDTFKLARKH